MQKVSNAVEPVCAVVGRDRFLRNEALAGILEALTAEMDSVGPTRFDGSNAILADVLDGARTLSLLGTRSVVVVDDADKFISANREALERYCSAPAQSGCLILLCQSLPKNTRLYRIIGKNGTIVVCEVPSRRALAPWIVRRARETYEKRLSDVAAQRLRELIGDSPGWLDAELSKLAAFVGERREITPADVESLTGHHREEKVFAVIDAMSSGDTASALRHWEQVLATDRAAPGRAIAGLAWSVRRLLQARTDWESGVSAGELARRMYTEPSVLQRRLERTTRQALEGQRRDLLAADIAVKTGASTVDVAVEKFIVKHSVRSDVGRSRAG